MSFRNKTKITAKLLKKKIHELDFTQVNFCGAQNSKKQTDKQSENSSKMSLQDGRKYSQITYLTGDLTSEFPEIFFHLGCKEKISETMNLIAISLSI